MKTLISKQSKMIILLTVFTLIAIISCRRPLVVITEIPANTPPGSILYLAGNFNRWDPGDVRSRCQLLPDSSFLFIVPRGFGRIEYKITRGEWSMVETDDCGYDINNRTLQYVSGDTAYVKVLSWKDTSPVNCPEMVIVIEKLPDNTPSDDPVALAGNFNDWLPDSSWYLRRHAQSGRYFINLTRPETGRTAEFKVTRGSLITAEADAFGYEREIRRVIFGQTDTLFINVENWEDLSTGSDDRLTIILEKIPANTPSDDRIYLTGTFNGWYPRDNKYLFTINEEGLLEISIPKKSNEIEFKITRGDWSKEEADIAGYRMSNRYHHFSGRDTLRLNIAGWIDMTKIKQPEFTIVIKQIPENTPPNDDLYFAGNINRWNPGQRNYRFNKSPSGFYYLTLRDTPSAVQFKITRGNWFTEEADVYGNPPESRNFFYDGATDSVFIKIENWKDLRNFEQRQVVIVIEKTPENTPHNARIFIAGNFNNWNPEHPDYILNKNLQGQYYITIPTTSREIAFKFTLGGWQKEELNSAGEPVSNRVYRPGYTDTLRLMVEKWRGVSD
jgi:hypothetical protein